MSSLAEYIADKLAEEEGVEVSSEKIQSFIDEHSEIDDSEKPAPKKKTATKVAPKSSKTKASAKTEHTCERTINGKEGSRICGKKANNELNDMWFCGTEKSGCYKSALSKTSAPAPKAKTAAKGKSTAKSAVIQKIQKKEKINLHEVPEGSDIWVDLNNYRMVYSKDPRETYGILEDDDETISPLTEEAIAFAESHGINIREAAPKTKAKSKVVAKGKTVASKTAPKSKVVASKGKAVAPKAVAKGKAKVVPKGKAKAKAKKEDEEMLEDLQQDAEDVEVEDVEISDAPEIDLGEADAEGVDEVVDDDDDAGADVEDVDEGEAADDGDEEEDVEDEE